MKQINVYTKEEYIGQNCHFAASIKHKDDVCVPIHFHEYYELEIVVSGQGKTILNGETIYFKQGSVFCLTPTDFHDYTQLDDITLYHLSFSVSVCDEYVKTMLEEYIPRFCHFSNDENFNSLLHLFQSLLYVDKDNTDFFCNVLKAMIHILPQKRSHKANFLRQDLYAQKAIQYIQRNFRENISSDFVAKYCGISTDYLRRVFIDNYKITPAVYIRNTRLNYAAQLLKKTCLSISEVALNSGFQSIQSFNRAFKTHFSMSPLQYKKTDY